MIETVHAQPADPHNPNSTARAGAIGVSRESTARTVRLQLPSCHSGGRDVRIPHEVRHDELGIVAVLRTVSRLGHASRANGDASTHGALFSSCPIFSFWQAYMHTQVPEAFSLCAHASSHA